ncbi:hypothetical protein [Epilithonimonas hominis]|uniref:Uncharacterized protein n=1 Tax=Epilithonimonas hominis TaxID=420404 RepID=A0A3N0XAV4_9FLAO|nr:hypothetical protein [Epilithonimonas hominis]ROI14492.1 hypothetical protein EGH73_02660 [Epilithonimonas hominis]
MGKVILITGILYILYYAGNLVYDLFIKKPIVVTNQNEGELISLGSIMEIEPEPVKNIREEEVEDLNTPNSYQLDDEELLFSDNDQNSHKERFEEENEIEQFSLTETQEAGTENLNSQTEEKKALEEKEEQQSFLSRLGVAIGIGEKEITSKSKEIIPIKISDEAFRNFFEKASNHIVIANDNGQNFYKSSLVY